MKKLAVLLFVLSGLLLHDAAGQCPCGPDQKVRLQLKGIAKLVGKVHVIVKVGDTIPLNGEFDLVGPSAYTCVEWPNNVTVEPKLDEPVRIEYLYSDDPSSPDFAEFDADAVFDGVAANPVVFMRKPGAKCPDYYFDTGHEDWVRESAVAFTTQENVIRIRVHMPAAIEQCGNSTLSAGTDKSQADVSEFMDSKEFQSIIDKCPNDAAMAAAMTVGTTDQSNANRQTARKEKKAGLKSSYPKFEVNDHREVNEQKSTSSMVQSQTLATSISSTVTPPYALTDQIGSLHWEMSLGHVSNALPLGHLVYKASSLDNTVLQPQHLEVSEASDPRLVLRDIDGNLRQIEMSSHLVDISVGATALAVNIYGHSQISGFDATNQVYLINGEPLTTWTITSPSGLGSIRFTKMEGNATEVHDAQWQGTAGVSGTMTISRYNGKWKEERTYSMANGGTQRIETISEYKNSVLQHKVREVHQQFSNWGQPGQVFEAMVQKVEDPDGQALTTTYEFWDQTNMPGNLLKRVFYPDGYQEWMPTRIGIGGGAPPIFSDGELLRLVTSYKDSNPTTTTGRERYTVLQTTSSTQMNQRTTTKVNQQQVGYKEVYHDFSSGSWLKQTFEAADETGVYTYKEEWINPDNRDTLFTLDPDGTTRDFLYTRGYWDTASQTFVGTDNGSTTVPARRTRITYGSINATGGIPNKTLIEQRVQDQFGKTVLEESYVNTGGGVSSANLIDRKLHVYIQGLLVLTVQNDRATYEAGYYSNGDLEFEINESGQRTEFQYDELHRIRQKLIRGRGGDADRVIAYEYDVFGNVASEQISAGELIITTSSQYNLAGELQSTIGVDGLVTSISTNYSGGNRIVSETLPTQATRITSYFKDRQLRSVTGSAVEDLYFNPFLGLWTATSYREAVSTYRDSAMTQLKQTRLINWLGNEILIQTKQFRGVGNRNRYTTYDVNGNGATRQLPVKIEETGRVRQLFTYDLLSRQSARGLDFDNNGSLNAASNDRITTQDQSYSNNSGAWEGIITIERQLIDAVDAPVLQQRIRRKLPVALTGNLVASQITEQGGGGVISTTVSLDRNSGSVTTIVDNQELGQINSQIKRDGLVRSETRTGISGSRTFLYTALGEVETVNDPVTGTVTYTYNAATRQLESTTDSLTRQTLYTYYAAGSANAGMLKGKRDTGQSWTYFDYTPDGSLFRTWGTNVYPEESQYNEAGQRTALKTFRTRSGDVNWASATWPTPAGGDTTQWVYDQASDLLDRKTYADNSSVAYQYDAGNFLDSKTNARGQVCDYAFDGAGQLTGITYSDGTPAVNNTYDRAGRTKTITDASGTRTVTWTIRDQMEDETYTSGALAGIGIDRGFDSKFRLQTTELKNSGSTLSRQKVAYDSISWVDYIADESPDGTAQLHKFDYSFKPGTQFIQSVDFSRAGTPVMVQGFLRDSVGRLTGAGATLAGGNPLRSVSYQLDNLDRRRRADRDDGTYWDYGYNNRSEVTSGKKKFASGTFVGGNQYEYDFDDIGNRLLERSGGDSAGANLRSTTYSAANSVNQLTTRNPSGSIFITGEAPVSLTLQGFLDQQSFTLTRQESESFFGEASVDNSQMPVYTKLKVVGKNGASVEDVQSGNRFVPRTPEAFGYDSDGNLVQDGRWSYSWDAENRLTQMETTPLAVSAGAPKQRLKYFYDHGGRRFKSELHTWNSLGGTYQLSKTTFFTYDGWNILADLDEALVPRQLYQWGLDLSGTRQGAGGVGGLLATKIPATSKTYYYSVDGNGNVQQVLESETSTVAAEYEYSPFGRTIAATGAFAEANQFRFSTKWCDQETGLNYYGYRFYDAECGRWLSRDPIGERGGGNLYGFVNNDPIQSIDLFGLSILTITLKRNYHGYLALYGELNIQSDDEKTNTCCNLPLHFYTIESVGVTLRSKGTYTPTLDPENSSLESGKGLTSIMGKIENGILKNWWRRDQATYPSKPPGMSDEEYMKIINLEFRTNGSDGINVHFGPNANHSTGCALVGTKYIGAVMVPNGERFGPYNGQVYKAYSFGLTDSIQSEFDMFAAIRCAQKRGASLRYVVENDIREISEGIEPPVPLDPSQYRLNNANCSGGKCQ